MIDESPQLLHEARFSATDARNELAGTAYLQCADAFTAMVREAIDGIPGYIPAMARACEVLVAAQLLIHERSTLDDAPQSAR